jgi:hypothetical protein
LRPSHRAPALSVVILLTAFPVAAQFPSVTLSERTIQEFDAYAQKVEKQLSARWHGQRSFLEIDEIPELRQKALHGEIPIRPGGSKNPVDISDGLVADWIGDVFIPNTSMERVLSVLQDFDHHAKIYPEITRSRLLKRDGNHISGYWRLEKKDQLIPVVLDVIDEASYQQVSPGKWICRAYAKDVSEVQDAGTSHEKKLPPGHGQGFLWRLYAYWSLESVNGGVLAECRAVSLSRSVPPGLGWAVKPLIRSLPRDSLTSTLRNTREGVVTISGR